MVVSLPSSQVTVKIETTKTTGANRKQTRKVGEGVSITRIKLETEADISGIDHAAFQKHTLDGKMNCPVSKALTGADIRLNAKLL
jgi:lipoyl-dependent peroxiredoxin